MPATTTSSLPAPFIVEQRPPARRRVALVCLGDWHRASIHYAVQNVAAITTASEIIAALS